MLIEFTTTHIIFIIKLYYFIVKIRSLSIYYFINITSTLMCARACYSPLSAWKTLGGKQQCYCSLTNTFILKVTRIWYASTVSHTRARARDSPLSAWNTSGDINLLFERQCYRIRLKTNTFNLKVTSTQRQYRLA